jgi:hypothetical protein
LSLADRIEARFPDIHLEKAQLAWYQKKREEAKAKGKLGQFLQERPSFPEEAFEQAIEGAVYGEQMTWLREQGRILDVPIDPAHKVHTFWDLGKRDKTAIWFMQHVLGQFRWVRYHEDSNKDLRHYWRDILEEWRREHGLAWGRHFLPHDAAIERLGAINTTMQQELTGLGMEDSVIVPVIPELATGIDLTRKALTGAHYFDKTHCADGIKCLDGYQYEWDDKLGVWSRLPLHNWASHGADAWRQFAQGWEALGASNDASFRSFKTRNRTWR